MTEPYEPIGRKSRKLEGSVVLPNSAAASFLSSPYKSAKVVTFPIHYGREIRQMNDGGPFTEGMTLDLSAGVLALSACAQRKRFR